MPKSGSSSNNDGPGNTVGKQSKRDEKSLTKQERPLKDGVSSASTMQAPSQQQEPPKRKSSNSLPRLLIQGIVHIACILIYLIPILAPNEFAGPTLDESHVMARDVQKDIHDPNATWKQIFSNDYWGRPMNSPSSHKSWRPLTILSFRFLRGPYVDLTTQSLQQLTLHRFVNIVCHAAAAELVGQLATQLFVPNTNENAMWLQLIIKVIFCLQPTHVEVAANAANRGHILVVLLTLILCFPGTKAGSSDGSSIQRQRQRLRVTTPFWLFLLALISGYLSSETFLFMIPGVMVTMTVIAFTAADATNRPMLKSKTELEGDRKMSSELKRFIVDYIFAMISIAPRLILLVASVGVYLGGRWYFDTLDIPTGLIRPAESPYYTFEGTRRFKNYLYVLTIHLGKQWGLILPKNLGGDPIGFSHEYGFECIPEIEVWSDGRFVFGVGFHLLFAVAVSVLLVSYKPRRFFGLVAMHWSWTLFSLFPICGIMKVGTFVSDRIVVPASVVSSIWIGKVVHNYATDWLWKKDSPFRLFRPLQFVFVLWWIVTSSMTVHNRSLEWMDSISLMESALVTCPRFAKAHMEVSKIYSGLYPSLLDLKKARFHLDTAKGIDPDLCDLHKQYVYVGLQQGRYLEVEKELTQAILCPFTASEAVPMYNNYWSQLMQSTPQGTSQYAEIQARYHRELAIGQEGILKEQKAQEANEGGANSNWSR